MKASLSLKSLILWWGPSPSVSSEDTRAGPAVGFVIAKSCCRLFESCCSHGANIHAVFGPKERLRTFSRECARERAEIEFDRARLSASRGGFWTHRVFQDGTDALKFQMPMAKHQRNVKRPRRPSLVLLME